MTVPPVPSARPDDPRDGSAVGRDAGRSGYIGHDELTMSFDAFYKESRDRLVVQTLALTGDLAVARSAVREAFVVTWHHWRKHVRNAHLEAIVREVAWRKALRCLPPEPVPAGDFDVVHVHSPEAPVLGWDAVGSTRARSPKNLSTPGGLVELGSLTDQAARFLDAAVRVFARSGYHGSRVGDIGNAGPDKGQGGKYLLLPPDYTGGVPDGYFPTCGVALQVHSEAFHSGTDADGKDRWSATVEKDGTMAEHGVIVVPITPSSPGISCTRSAP